MRLVAAALATWAGAACAQPSPAGLWASPADAVAPAREISLAEDGATLSGRIAKTDPARDTICFKCDDDRKGQPVLGMEVLRGAKRDGENWLGGQWLEPQTGTLYRARLTLSDDGGTLTVRGTVGLALMGRSQVWTRVADGPGALVKMVQRVPVGPVGVDGLVFVDAQGPARDGVVPAGFADQARAAWANLDARLAEAKSRRDDVVSVTVTLADRADVAQERAIRDEMLAHARSAVTVIVAGLPERAWLIQISAITR